MPEVKTLLTNVSVKRTVRSHIPGTLSRILCLFVATFAIDGLLVATSSSSAAADSADWNVMMPSDRRVTPGTGVPVSVYSGSGGAEGLAVRQDTVAEPSTMRPLFTDSICKAPAGDCATPAPIPSGTLTTVYLQTAANAPPGVYAGNVTISSKQQPSGATTQLKFYVTDSRHKFLGVVVLLLGVVVAWFLNVFIRNSISYDQLEYPVSILRTKLDQLSAGINSDPKWAAAMDPVKKAIGRVKDDLAPTNVKLVLPNRWAASSVDTAAYHSYLDPLSLWVTDLSALCSAAEIAFGYYTSGTKPNVDAAVLALVATLSSYAVGVNAPAQTDLATNINTVLAKLPAIGAGAGEHELVAPIGAAPGPSMTIPTPMQIQLEIAKFNLVYSFGVALITVLLGAYIFIFSSNGAGFGTNADLMVVGFWGLGLPSASTLLTSTTSVVTSVFTLPR